MRSVLRSQCSQIPPVTLLPAPQAAERFVCNKCQLPLNPRKLKIHPEASPRPLHHHPPPYMEFCVPGGLGVVEQVQYLSPSKPCLRRCVLEWVYIYIHLWRQNKSESICLKYTSFFISPHTGFRWGKSPLGKLFSPLRDSKGQCDGIGKVKVKWITQSTRLGFSPAPQQQRRLPWAPSSKTGLWQVEKRIGNPWHFP